MTLRPMATAACILAEESAVFVGSTPYSATASMTVLAAAVDELVAHQRCTWPLLQYALFSAACTQHNIITQQATHAVQHTGALHCSWA